MKDQCENSQTNPCRNKPYRVARVWAGSLPLVAVTLCRKHYRQVMAVAA